MSKTIIHQNKESLIAVNISTITPMGSKHYFMTGKSLSAKDRNIYWKQITIE